MRPIKLFSDLQRLLRQFDGTNIAVLDNVMADNPASPALLLHLIRLAEHGEATMQIAATALLKRYQAAGVSFPARVVKRLLELLPSAMHGKSQLHLLQMLPELPIPRDQADFLCESLSDCLTNRNKFIRTWAHGGLHHLASQYSEYRDEVATLLDRAGKEEAPSVRARLRRLTPLSKNLVRSRATSPCHHRQLGPVR